MKSQTARDAKSSGTISSSTVRLHFFVTLSIGCPQLISFYTGPIIRFLRQNINQLGGDINSNNIFCRRCPKRQAGGFDPDYGIQICANELRGSQSRLEDTLAHEMVHAYDHLRFKLDWTGNLRHAACTEVCIELTTNGVTWGNAYGRDADSSIVTEWGVQMGKGVLQQGSVEVDTTSSRVCEAKGSSFCEGETRV